MSLTQLLQTNHQNKNIKEILKICKNLNKKELEISIDGIAPPLTLAAYFACPEAIKVLLSKGSNINQIGNEGSPPIFWAFMADNLPTINLLMESKKKVDLTIVNSSGKTPFFPLCSHLNDPKYLVQAIKMIGKTEFRKIVNKPSDSGETLLSGCLECMTNYKDKKDTLDLEAAYRNIIEKIEILIEHGADVRKNIMLGSQEFSLLDFVNNNKLISFFPDIAENLAVYLIGKGFNGKNCGKNSSILYTFSQYGNFSAVKLLVENGYDINKKVSQDCTALIGALSKDNFTIAKYLISEGADVNAKMTNGQDAIYFAIKGNDNSFTRELLEIVDIKHSYPKAINVDDIKLPANFNLLHLCCEVKNLDIITVLLGKGMDMYDKGSCSKTPYQILDSKRIDPSVLDFVTRQYGSYKNDYAKNNNKIKNNNRVEECAICMEPIYDEISVLSCNHIFHSSCILQWISRGDSPKCPLCRAPLELKYKVKLPEKLASPIRNISIRKSKRAMSLPPMKNPLSLIASTPETSISDEPEDLFGSRPRLTSTPRPKPQSRKRAKSLSVERKNRRSAKKQRSAGAKNSSPSPRRASSRRASPRRASPRRESHRSN